VALNLSVSGQNTYSMADYDVVAALLLLWSVSRSDGV